MSVRIVNILKVIDIHQDDPYRRFFSMAAVKFLFQQLDDGGPIPELGQTVFFSQFFEFRVGLDKLILKVNDTFPCLESGSEFQGVEGLNDVIIGSCPESFKDVLFPILGCQQDDIRVVIFFEQTHFLAQF